MSWTNYHSHTAFSDGAKEPEAHLLEAISLGMPAYGFSDHSPIPFPSSWSIQKEEFDAYNRIIDQLKETYQDQIQVYKGLEMDYIPGHFDMNMPMIKAANLDYTIGSIHFTDFHANGNPWEIDGRHKPFLEGLEKIFDNDIQKMVCRYYELTREMVLRSQPDVVGHIDKIKIQSEDGVLFNENSSWYKDAVMETLELIAKEELIVEVNTRGIYKKLSSLYPSHWILEEMYRLGIRVMINSDSHHPRELINYFPETAQTLKEIGFSELSILLDGKWQSVGFSDKGLQK